MTLPPTWALPLVVVDFVRVDGDKLTMESPGVIVPMTGATIAIWAAAWGEVKMGADIRR